MNYILDAQTSSSLLDGFEFIKKKPSSDLESCNLDMILECIHRRFINSVPVSAMFVPQ